MDMYLFKCYQVRAVLVGTRPHPFIGYSRLQQYWAHQGKKQWQFDKTKTFQMLQAVEQNGHADFHHELLELLWFGGVLSYGNIMRETYSIMYDWIDPTDMVSIEGLCEEDDGPSLRQVIISSLRIIRVNHTQAIISSYYDELDALSLVMCQRGMASFFAQIIKIRSKLKDYNEVLSDDFLLRIVYKALAGKHKALTDKISDQRTTAGRTKIPTTFEDAKDQLMDAFDFEIPDDEKCEQPPTISANYAGKRRQPGTNDNNFNNGKGKRRRRNLPKGSCTNCPESTSHYTRECYLTIREKMGLPPGFQWCLYHKKGTHYEHTCKRHAPNFPDPPTACPPVTKANVAANTQLNNNITQLLSWANNQSQQPAQQPQTPIKIDYPDNKDFRTARSTPANAATSGPTADNVFSTILKMTKQEQANLTAKLIKAKANARV